MVVYIGMVLTLSTPQKRRALRCSTGPNLIYILCITHPTRCLLPLTAGVPGLEPRLTESESVGLPITPYPKWLPPLDIKLDYYW